MGLKREQYDVISNMYNMRRLNNKIELEERIAKVYEKAPEVEEISHQISSLAISAGRKALAGDSSAVDSLKRELVLLKDDKKAALLAAGFPCDYLDEIFTCPNCKDTGFINGEPCHCFTKAVVEELYSQSNLKEILMRENFDNFNFDYYNSGEVDSITGKTPLENIEDVVDHCRYFIKNFKDSHESLLIYGNAGVGKTFLVNCIAKELIEQAYSVIYLSAVQLFDLLADLSFNSHKSTGNKHISMRELLSCDLLIIDDLGTEMANSFTASSLFNCLNERLIRQKSTIISSNLSVDKLKQNYTERIFSRAVGNYTVMKIFGDDIRIKSKFNN